MTLPTLELEPDRKERAVQSIADMLTTHNQKQKERKHSEQLADLIGIPKEKRGAFSQLPPDLQKTYATMFQKERKEAGQVSGKITKGTSKFLKDYYPSLEANPESKRSIEEIAQRLASEQNLSDTDAIKAAVKEFRAPKQGTSLNEQSSLAGDNRSILDTILSLKNPLNAPKKPFSTTEAAKALTHPGGIDVIKEHPGRASAAASLGIFSPIEEALRYQSKPAREFIEQLGFTYPKGSEKGKLFTEQLREKLYEGLSAEQQAQAGKLEFLGGLIPVESLFMGLSRIGKHAGFLKNAEKIAAREGISSAEAVQKVVKEAEGAGIDIAKAAAGDKQEAGKLFNLSNRVSLRTPSSLTPKQTAIAENTLHNAKRFRIPVSENGTIKLYHGTRSGQLIEKSGVIKNSPFFTTSKEEAMKFAQAAHGTGKPEVFEVNLYPHEISLGGGTPESTYGTSINESIPLRKKVSQADITPTEMRMQRAEPKAKMFPKEERISTREAQLKAFPKYEAEIAQDAAERAARAEAKIPKTVKGMDAKRLRVHAAEKNLPKAEEGFRKAVARTRALEDEIASALKKHGEDSKIYKHLQDLLKLSRNELKDSEFFLKQTMQNIAGGEARKGLAEMRGAAQEKMLKISDQIAAGEEVKLAKMDYNPEMVKEAQRISKKKAIPAVKQDDFYQQVHLEYGNQYRKQLEKIEKELKAVPKTMAQAEQIRNLQKEKEVLKKLIDQTEAERTIHRHKLSLRETAERHKAKERFKELQPSKAEPKVAKAAQERMWKEKIQEAIKDPSGEAAEDLAKKTGAKKEEFKQAKSEFKDAWGKVKEEASKVKESKGKKVPPAGTDLKKELTRTLRNIQKKRFFHIFMRTPVGREILYSLAVATANDAFNLKINPYLQAAAGRRLAMYPIRAAFNQVYHWINPKKQIAKHQYRNAVEGMDDETVARIKRQHPSWVKEFRRSAD